MDGGRKKLSMLLRVGRTRLDYGSGRQSLPLLGAECFESALTCKTGGKISDWGSEAVSEGRAGGWGRKLCLSHNPGTQLISGRSQSV